MLKAFFTLQSIAVVEYGAGTYTVHRIGLATSYNLILWDPTCEAVGIERPWTSGTLTGTLFADAILREVVWSVVWARINAGIGALDQKLTRGASYTDSVTRTCTACAIDVTSIAWPFIHKVIELARAGAITQSRISHTSWAASILVRRAFGAESIARIAGWRGIIDEKGRRAGRSTD